MVARPPVRIAIERMGVEDLAAVQEIERESFSTPWPPNAYREELRTNRLAYYVVARHGDQIVGFAGLWMQVDEAHITTFATRTAWRRQGVGERMLVALLEYAQSRGAREATLEVRPSLFGARHLYEKFGFELVGVRPRYYTDNNEDALIMTTPDLNGRRMRERLDARRAELQARPDIALGGDGLPIPRVVASDGVVRPDGEGRAGGRVVGDGVAGEGRRVVAPDVIQPSNVRRQR